MIIERMDGNYDADDVLERAGGDLDNAEAADDLSRLKLLDELYGALEKELGLDETGPPRY